MPSADLPETDLRRVASAMAKMWPEKYHGEVKAEYHVRGKSVTLCETRAPWDGEGVWTHLPMAQLRYRAESGDWALYWADRNSRWRKYDPDGFHVTGTCARLLAEFDTDPTSIFKG